MIIPYCLGRAIAPKNAHGVFTLILWGYIVLWGLFELVAVPSIYFGRSLDELTLGYGAVVAAASVLAVIFFRKKMLQDVAAWRHFFGGGEFRRVIFFAVVDFALILAQAAFVFLYMHEDADDAEYVVMANDAWERGSLLVTNPYTGFKWEDASTKRLISPFSLWIAVISKITRIAPARVAHVYLPVLIIFLGYAAVFAALREILENSGGMPDTNDGLDGRRFYDSGKNSRAPWVALMFFSLMVIFGGGSTRSYGSMVLLRAWQGKAVLCAALLPLLLSELAGTNAQVESWIIKVARLIMLSLAALLTTGMAIPMVPLMVGAFGVVYGCEWILRKFR